MRLSAKGITALVIGSTVVVGAAVAVPVAVVFTQPDQNGQTGSVDRGILRVPYQKELVPPEPPAGYAPGVLVSTTYAVGMPVSSKSLVATYLFVPDGTVYPLTSKQVSYVVLVDPAQVTPTSRSTKLAYVYGSGKIPPPADDAFPSREGTGYLDWDKATPSWWVSGARTEITTFDKIIQMPVGSTFYALYTSLVDTTNYAGNSDVFRVNYQVVPSATTAVKVAITGTVPYGTTALPGSGTDLPKLSAGYNPWDGPVYADADRNAVTAESLAKMPAGSKFTALWTSQLDTRYYVGENSSFLITYTVTKQYAATPSSTTLYDSTSLVYGATALPRLPQDRLPDLAFGYLSWSSVVAYSVGNGAPLDQKNLATLPAGTVVTAVYTTIPDPNYATQPYSLSVIYTIAQAPLAAFLNDPVSDNSSVAAGQKTFPVYPSLPTPPAGYLPWASPVFTRPDGTKVVTANDLAAVQAGTVLTATYTADVDGNHLGSAAKFVVLYTVAAARTQPAQPSS